MKAVFLDRNGTVNVGRPTYDRVDSVDKVTLLPTVLEAMAVLAELDYGAFFVTNQAGMAEGRINEEQFNDIHQRVLELITPSGINILKTYVCPHGENSDCDCRKPKPKLLFDAAQEYDIELGNSWIVGDRPSDVLTGVNAGTRTILVKTGMSTTESVPADYTALNLFEAINYIANNRHLSLKTV